MLKFIAASFISSRQCFHAPDNAAERRLLQHVKKALQSAQKWQTSATMQNILEPNECTPASHTHTHTHTHTHNLVVIFKYFEHQFLPTIL